MTISPITGSDPAARNLLSGASSGAQGGTIGNDFTMFLRLLTTQMQNQDPLDPMDSSEYTQQLVQYSQVEQSVQQTGALKDILARLSTQDMTQATALIGKEVRFASEVSGLAADEPARWTFQTDRPAASITATVQDPVGNVVREFRLDPAGDGKLAWDGAQADGTRAPDGAYRLVVSALDASGGAVPATVNSVGLVRNIVASGSEIQLGIGGVRMPISTVIGVSQPSIPPSPAS